MRTHFRKCISCGRYTLRELCPACSGATKNPIPPRFSPADPYGKYRRMMKGMQRKPPPG